MSGHVVWTGAETVRANIRAYGVDFEALILRVAEYWQPVLEASAKENAPWTDRTANARQTLHTFVNQLSKDTVELYLAHGMEYGHQLETRREGKYAVIWPTIAMHLPRIAQMLEDATR